MNNRREKALSIEQLSAAPSVLLRNSELSVKLYLPDSERGFYRGCRFDWAGVIGSLRYRGHDFYVPWFQAMSPHVDDYVFDQGRVIASANTAACGPVEEFNDVGGALGYREASPGDVFVKIGVGALRRPDSAPYSPFGTYPLVDEGLRTHALASDRVVFTHRLDSRATGYAYVYIKTLRLLDNSATLLIEHELRNVGERTLATSVYDHNFLNIDGQGTLAGLTLTARFTLRAESSMDSAVVGVSGRRLRYLTSLVEAQCITTPLTGFGSNAADYHFQIATSGGVALTFSADQPLSRLLLWAIQPVMSLEPFIQMQIEPGQVFRWHYRYDFAVASPPAG